jgi:hypothetical protein
MQGQLQTKGGAGWLKTYSQLANRQLAALVLVTHSHAPPVFEWLRGQNQLDEFELRACHNLPATCVMHTKQRLSLLHSHVSMLP